MNLKKTTQKSFYFAVHNGNITILVISQYFC